MKNIIIDTNLLISFITDRNLEQQEKAARLFEQTSRLKSAVICHQNVIAEFVYVMDKLYAVGKTEIGDIVTDFLKMPGVKLSTIFNYKVVFELWPEKIPDFGDAMIASLQKHYPNASVATFNVKFQKALTKISVEVFGF